MYTANGHFFVIIQIQYGTSDGDFSYSVSADEKALSQITLVAGGRSDQLHIRRYPTVAIGNYAFYGYSSRHP